MVSFQLEDGVATVTGAASGMGRETAILFAEYGCRRLVLGDINVKGLEETRELIKTTPTHAQVEIKELDVGDEASVKAFYNHAVSTFGRIDFGVNIAGLAYPPVLTHESTSELLERIYHVNLKGVSISGSWADMLAMLRSMEANKGLEQVWLCERALLTQMLKQEPLKDLRGIRGSIVNISSLGATLPLPGLSIYSGTKGGVLGITRTDALDYGSKGIRVNCVAPGFVDTPMLKDMPEENLKQLLNRTPLGRLADAKEIANAVVWIASPLAGYMNGAYVPIDGGFYLKSGG